MAFDHEVHEIEPSTGFAVNKDTGGILGIHEVPPQPTRGGQEWPKWVPVHDSYIVRRQTEGAPDHVSVPAWPNYHVNRMDGKVSVLVHDEDEEKRAAAEYKEPTAKDAQPEIDPHIAREVHVEVEQAKRSEADEINDRITAERSQLEHDEALKRTAEEREQAERNRQGAAQLAEAERARAAAIAAKPLK